MGRRQEQKNSKNKMIRIKDNSFFSPGLVLFPVIFVLAYYVATKNSLSKESSYSRIELLE